MDTHAIVWLYTKELHKFSSNVLEILKHNYLLISPMVKLELQYLYDKKRVNAPPNQVLNSLQQVLHLKICHKNWLDVVNVALTCNFTRDAFDRLIVAHAMLDNSILISKDEKLTEHYKNCVW
ncbi:type II toxin-antitoxin system VapC family toxin [Moraxella oblonga]|uniref:type II toxin-antitoxin system VapC family toxin n=1 Tax=Moraxella oblonga TaxID=200413 RepID=UPI002480F080|nr:PIN domain-containing protein [Moraxella oblonga]